LQWSNGVGCWSARLLHFAAARASVQKYVSGLVAAGAKNGWALAERAVEPLKAYGVAVFDCCTASGPVGKAFGDRAQDFAHMRIARSPVEDE
jgi:hypothetical protein